MQRFKKIAAFILTIVLVGLSLQSIQAQKLPSGNKNIFSPKKHNGNVSNKTLQSLKLVKGKDLIITAAKLVKDKDAVESLPNKVACKVEFTVKNIGTDDCTERAPVMMYMLRYTTTAPRTNQPVFSDLVERRNGRTYPFKISPIKSGESKTFTAYLKYGLLKNYIYRIEMAVNATRYGQGIIRDEADASNNRFELAQVRL